MQELFIFTLLSSSKVRGHIHREDSTCSENLFRDFFKDTSASLATVNTGIKSGTPTALRDLKGKKLQRELSKN